MSKTMSIVGVVIFNCTEVVFRSEDIVIDVNIIIFTNKSILNGHG